MPQTHLGGLILATRNVPVRIRFTNELPATHILPVDPTIPGCESSAAQNRTAVHIHGGFVPWTSDGGPFDWWTPQNDGTPTTIGERGASFLNGPGGFLDLLPGYNTMGPGQADYLYPNDMSSRLTWYHDHALGLTRLNAYAGIASGYYIRDDKVALLESTGMIPPLSRLIPLVFQDKVFIPNGFTPDPGGITPAVFGNLWYPSVYDGPPPFTAQPPSCVPEFFGDTMLVNGKVFPFVEVEQRKYRFLALNACSARFLRIRLVYEDPASAGEPKNGYANPKPGPAFVQYASEGGFLPVPVTLPGTSPLNTLLLGCAERAEFTVDFSAVPAGTKLLLYNDASAPFPSGDDAVDYYPGNPVTPMAAPGVGPNARTIMQIRVKARVGAPDKVKPLVLPPLDPPSILSQAAGKTPVELTLNEDVDSIRAPDPVDRRQPGPVPGGKALRHPLSGLGDFRVRSRPPMPRRSRSGALPTSPATPIPCTSTWSTGRSFPASRLIPPPTRPSPTPARPGHRS